MAILISVSFLMLTDGPYIVWLMMILYFRVNIGIFLKLVFLLYHPKYIKSWVFSYYETNFGLLYGVSCDFTQLVCYDEMIGFVLCSFIILSLSVLVLRVGAMGCFIYLFIFLSVLSSLWVITFLITHFMQVVQLRGYLCIIEEEFRDCFSCIMLHMVDLMANLLMRYIMLSSSFSSCCFQFNVCQPYQLWWYFELCVLCGQA